MIAEAIEISHKMVTETKSQGGREGQKSYDLIKKKNLYPQINSQERPAKPAFPLREERNLDGCSNDAR